MRAKATTVLAGNSYVNMLDAVKSKVSRLTYGRTLRLYCEFTQMDTDKLIEIANKDLPGATEQVKTYMRHLKERVEVKKDLQPKSVALYFSTVKLLYTMNDILMNWTKISKMMPEKTTQEDRAYRKEEIDKILKVADIREKVIVLLLATAGLRIGALPDLKVKHLSPMNSKDGKLLAARLTVYPNTPDEYFTFITPECYTAIQEYLEYRKRNHEKVTGDAPLIRNKIRQGVPLNSSSRGNPKQLTSPSMSVIVWRLLIRSGVRELTDTKRYAVKMDHGFRKFFNTTCKKAKVDGIHKEMFLGHATGLDDSYYRPEPEDLLPDYLKVIPSLTFDDTEVLKVQNMSLQKEIEKEQEKDKRIERNETTVHSLMIHIREMKEKEQERNTDSEKIKEDMAEVKRKYDILSKNMYHIAKSYKEGEIIFKKEKKKN